MTKNPLINALSAVGYIGLINFIFSWLGKTQGPKPDSAFAPVLFLSMLTLSVCVMTLIFFYQPLMLFSQDKKRQGLQLFAKTVGIFAILTLVVFLLVLL